LCSAIIPGPHPVQEPNRVPIPRETPPPASISTTAPMRSLRRSPQSHDRQVLSSCVIADPEAERQSPALPQQAPRERHKVRAAATAPVARDRQAHSPLSVVGGCAAGTQDGELRQGERVQGGGFHTPRQPLGRGTRARILFAAMIASGRALIIGPRRLPHTKYLQGFSSQPTDPENRWTMTRSEDSADQDRVIEFLRSTGVARVQWEWFRFYRDLPPKGHLPKRKSRYNPCQIETELIILYSMFV